VALLDLSDAGTPQLALFSKTRDNTTLMNVMDQINAVWGRGTLRSAAEGTRREWKMKRERMSPAYTTRWDQLPEVS
jgi:DNA polymerase V